MQRTRKLTSRSAAVFASVVVIPAFATQAACPTPAESAGGPTNAHTQYVETHLLPSVIKPGEKPSTLADRMRESAVPGISVAVIQGGKLAWARGWGVRDAGSCKPVTPDTNFQAASISKTVTAVLALRMVEQGKIGLDRNINDALKSWKLPVDSHLAPQGVTLRQLLSHTAGLGVHGFNGFAPGDALPTEAQMLDGLPPSKAGPVRSILPAGAQFEYSGGGYLVTELALADVSGIPFADLAQREVLSPLGMKRSSFAQPPSPAVLGNVAFGHSHGAPIPGNYEVVPQLAAGGLWSTPADLARLLIDIQASAAGKKGHLLSPAMTRDMLTPVKDNWGLGVAVSPDGPKRFGPDGVNNGYLSFMIADEKGNGIVVMANGDGSRQLMDEVTRAIATDYGWTGMAPTAMEEKTLSMSELSKAAGHFKGGGLDLNLEVKPDGLYALLVGAPPSYAERLIPLSPRRFRSTSLSTTVEFAPDFSFFTMIEGAPPMKLVRVVDKVPATMKADPNIRK